MTSEGNSSSDLANGGDCNDKDVDVDQLLSIDAEFSLDEDLTTMLARTSTPPAGAVNDDGNVDPQETHSTNDDDEDGDDLIASLLSAIDEPDVSLHSRSEHHHQDHPGSTEAAAETNATPGTAPSLMETTTTFAENDMNTSHEVVPLQQFLNAMTIIQDLEGRVASLEIQRDSLLEETSQQKMMIDSYEQKLSAFPQMMETLMAENDKMVAKAATLSAKSSYWDQHMRKEEEKHAKDAKMRTDTLQQSDFLADIVARKAVEQRHSSSLSINNKNKNNKNGSLWKRLSQVSLGSNKSNASSVGSSNATSSQRGGGENDNNGGGGGGRKRGSGRSSGGNSHHFTIDDLDDDGDDSVEDPSDLPHNKSTDDGVLNLIS